MDMMQSDQNQQKMDTLTKARCYLCWGASLVEERSRLWQISTRQGLENRLFSRDLGLKKCVQSQVILLGMCAGSGQGECQSCSL